MIEEKDKVKEKIQSGKKTGITGVIIFMLILLYFIYPGIYFFYFNITHFGRGIPVFYIFLFIVFFLGSCLQFFGIKKNDSGFFIFGMIIALTVLALLTKISVPAIKHYEIKNQENTESIVSP